MCVRNTGYPASLELHERYDVVADPAAEAPGQLRVIDKSGCDYLYPRRYFASVERPDAARIEAV